MLARGRAIIGGLEYSDLFQVTLRCVEDITLTFDLTLSEKLSFETAMGVLSPEDGRIAYDTDMAMAQVFEGLLRRNISSYIANGMRSCSRPKTTASIRSCIVIVSIIT